MTDIYDRFDKATREFTAVALVLDGQAVGRIVIKHGAAATAYVQIWGAEMACGRATGYGYDKQSAAVIDAVRRLPESTASDATWRTAAEKIKAAFADGRDGERWTRRLEAVGFAVCNVIG